MTKITPGWDKGVTPATRVEPAAPHGNPNPPTPHFIPEKTLGKPDAGVDQPFTRPGKGTARGAVR